MTRAMPAWLAERLEEDRGPLVGSRYARRLSCSCGAEVWRGLDEDACALVVSADPEPLDAAAEFLVRAFSSRWTFALRPRPGHRVELARRDHWQIRGEPAGSRETGPRSYVVLAEHACPATPATSEEIR